MEIRPEEQRDIDAIHSVTVEAFKNVAISNQTEQFIITALRRDNALSISLVASIENEIAGHIAFSPIAISDGSVDWYTLGPVSVRPTFQKQGIGSALIKKGLSELKEMNAQGCVLVGNPNYYRRFGFKNDSRLLFEGVPAEVFLILPFGDTVPRGNIELHKGFWATE